MMDSSSKSLEDMLLARADEQRQPFYGGMELTPVCNMRCAMCYVREEYDTVANRLLTGEQWIELGKAALENGVFSMLITGGEPLLHPDFREIYLAVQNMGFVVKLNTNATLIDEEWADFFAENPCRQLNITLYGSSNDTYRRLCHNPRGFDQTMRALKLLKERSVPFRLNFTVTRENYNDLNEIASIAESLGVWFIPTTYLYPPRQEQPDLEAFHRIRPTPREAAMARLMFAERMSSEYDRRKEARGMLKHYLEHPVNGFFREGLPCRGGRSGFWIDWRGNITACSSLREPAVSLLDKSFAEAWEQLTLKLNHVPRCEKCLLCRKQFFCHSCTASSVGENGDSSKEAEYLCQMTDEMLDILLSWLPEGEQAYYRKALDEAETS